MTKKYKIELLQSARSELAEITRFHKRLAGLMSSRKIAAKIKNSINNLRVSPYLGMPCRDKKLARLGYRFLVCGNYLCFYHIDENTDHIYIHRILDGRTDYEKKLGNSLANRVLDMI